MIEMSSNGKCPNRAMSRDELKMNMKMFACVTHPCLGLADTRSIKSLTKFVRGPRVAMRESIGLESFNPSRKHLTSSPSLSVHEA